jgi:acetolactate synthase small subunit
MQASHAVRVMIDDDLLAFNRAIGVVRRRNLPVAEITVGPSGQPGVLRLRFVMQADDANAERLLRQLEKAHGVRGVEVFPVSHPSEAML